MTFTSPITLRGNLVTLEPLSRDHHDGLVAAVSDGRLWEKWSTRIPAPDEMADEVDHRLSLRVAGSMNPWTVIRSDTGAVCGMTTFMNIATSHRHVEIGSTWLAESAQRTGINTESKLLLLPHAFETLNCIAVEFRTHWHNRQSREAITRLGAKQDGVLRNHQIGADGTLRDTVSFSIIASEWPTVKLGLEAELTRGGTSR